MRAGRPTTDWIPTRSGFGDAEFDALWSAVARFITEEARAIDAPRQRRNVGVERTQVGLDDAQRGKGAGGEVVTANERARQVLEDLSEPTGLPGAKSLAR